MKKIMLVAFGVAFATLSVHAAEIDYDTQVRDRLWTVWLQHKAEADNKLVPKIRFHISKDGSPSDVRIDERSRDPAFEAKVLKWVDQAAPFPPPPNGGADFAWDFSWEADLVGYMDNLQKHIKRHWRAKYPHEPHAVKVHFFVARDGQVSDVKIAESSGSRGEDDGAVRAVKEAAPLPSLPPKSPAKVEIIFEFSTAKTEEAARLMQTDPATLNNMAVTLMKQNKLDKAIPLFEQLVVNHPNYPYARVNLCIAYNNKTIKEKSPEATAKLLYRALYLDYNKTGEDNLLESLEALGIKPKTVDDHIKLARSLQKKGDYVAAVVHCTIAKQIKRDDAVDAISKELAEPARKQFAQAVRSGK